MAPCKRVAYLGGHQGGHGRAVARLGPGLGAVGVLCGVCDRDLASTRVWAGAGCGSQSGKLGGGAWAAVFQGWTPRRRQPVLTVLGRGALKGLLGASFALMTHTNTADYACSRAAPTGTLRSLRPRARASCCPAGCARQASEPSREAVGWLQAAFAPVARKKVARPRETVASPRDFLGPWRDSPGRSGQIADQGRRAPPRPASPQPSSLPPPPPLARCRRSQPAAAHLWLAAQGSARRSARSCYRPRSTQAAGWTEATASGLPHRLVRRSRC